MSLFDLKSEIFYQFLGNFVLLHNIASKGQKEILFKKISLKKSQIPLPQINYNNKLPNHHKTYCSVNKF